MIVDRAEALLVIILISYCLTHEKVKYTDVAEGLGEVKLLKRIADEFPSLCSHVDLVMNEFKQQMG